MTQPFTHCPITGLLAHANDYNPRSMEYQYYVNINSQEVDIFLSRDYSRWENDPDLKGKMHIVGGLLLNERLFKFDGPASEHELTLDKVKKALIENSYPQSPQEKYDNLFSYLANLQVYEGQSMQLTDSESLLDDVMGTGGSEFLAKKLFFNGKKELEFYFYTLRNDGLIKEDGPQTGGRLPYFSVTYKGLSYAVKLEKEGNQSKNCFIAMSFGKEMGPTREAIKEACRATGYIPKLIDEEHHDSDITINDAMIALLKKCRFCIADFTEQKMGVYFESGFALGQGKQVIYSCHTKSFFDEHDKPLAHFDTNHFPHLLYDTPDELKQKLIDKIEAWIR